MSDTISRQAAIDVLAEMQGRCTTKAALIQNSKIWQQIKDLPSAEPGWIPTSERVPEVGTYIVTGKQKYDWEDKWHYFVDVAYCPGNYVDFFWDTFNDWDEGQETHIIAWMPLPEPWKGGAE